MKSIMRLYVSTSKGNDHFLYKQLLSLNIKPKFDENLNAFYFQANFNTLFEISFRSYLVENMYIQIGQKFNAYDQQQIAQSLEKIQFKNYLPISKGLMERTTLKILVRQAEDAPSENILIYLMKNCLEKEIYKREFFQKIVGNDNDKTSEKKFRVNQQSYHEIKEIVSRKWAQQQLEDQIKLAQIEGTQQPPSLSSNLPSIKNSKQKYSPITLSQQKQSQQLIETEYDPNLTLYIKRRFGRVLLKINKKEMYKYGWKKQVGWGSIRQSIIAAVLLKSQVLKSNITLWDPFCGSGTIPIVALSINHHLPIRSQFIENFNWPFWSIYKPSYLQQYQQNRISNPSQSKLKIVASDVKFQTVNYAIKNIDSLVKSIQINNEQKRDKDPLIVKRNPMDQIYEVLPDEIACICGDFEKVAQNLFGKKKEKKVTIVTNLPYTEGLSKDHMPLNQLTSLYNRFCQLLKNYHQGFENVFIILNNSSFEIAKKFHFLNISSSNDVKWNLVGNFQSGGKHIGLYAWEHNKKFIPFQEFLTSYKEIILLKDKVSVLQKQQKSQQLEKYRKKIQQIDNKMYKLPNHLVKVKTGWRRVVQKRRKRHLVRVYEVFSKRRDKSIAFRQYMRKKLENSMVMRGMAWRKRNMKFFGNKNVLSFEGELKKEFQSIVENALVKSEQRQTLQKQKRQEITKKRQGKKIKLSEKDKKILKKRDRASKKVANKRLQKLQNSKRILPLSNQTKK